MRTNSAGKYTVTSDVGKVSFDYQPTSEFEWVDIYLRDSGAEIACCIKYQEFIEMANEIIRQKEEHDATTGENYPQRISD